MIYDLARLGWLQFQRLCDLLLAGDAKGWTGEADHRREAVVEGRLALGEVALDGPVVVVARFVRREVASHHVLDRLVDAATRSSSTTAGPSVLVVTNAPLTEAGRRTLRERLTGDPEGRRVDVLDGRRLCRLIDERPGLRRALPSLLGVREPADPLARVFVATGAYAATLAALERHGFAVLTGPPEMGKTAIARMVALAQASGGWAVHECLEPAALWRAYDPAAAQVFVADDAFGSTEYRPDGAERWARALPDVLPRLDERHWLVWTSRPAPLRAGLARVRRQEGLERFPLPGEVGVDAGALGADERALILLRHAQAADLPPSGRRLVRRHALTLVEHPHFTPERIRRLVTELPHARGDAAAAEIVRAALSSPTDAMRASFRALGAEHRAVLQAMLDQPPGPVPERALATGLRALRPGAHGDPHALLASLGEHFVRTHHGRVEWIHPGWRDVVIDDLAERAEERRAFLRACGLDGVALALSTGGGATGRREMPLLRSDADWDALGDRLGPLVRELDDVGLGRLLELLLDAAEQLSRPGQLAELKALVDRALRLATGRWSGRIVPVDGLAAWWRLARALPPPPAPPNPAPTWAELEPVAVPEGGDQQELDRLEAWLTLVAVLAQHDPRALPALGFPGRRRALLEEIADRIVAEPLRGPPAQLERIRRAIGELVQGRHRTSALALEPWEELPPSEAPAPAPAASDVAGRVERILADLG